MVSTDGDGYKFVKTELGQIGGPQPVGDKHFSRHGQKGTVGTFAGQQDMPFTKNGIEHINESHAVLGRMTGQIVECITGKAACSVNKFGDASPFMDKKLDELGDVLETSDFIAMEKNPILW